VREGPSFVLLVPAAAAAATTIAERMTARAGAEAEMAGAKVSKKAMATTE